MEIRSRVSPKAESRIRSATPPRSTPRKTRDASRSRCEHRRDPLSGGGSCETGSAQKQKGRPTEKERTHEPVREFENVIDLVAVLGSVWRLTKKFINEREAIHSYRNLP